MRKKTVLYEEPVYLLATVLISFSVALTAAADFGVSMVVAPAYILSLKVGFLSFGQAEYLVQGGLFVLLCILMRKVRFPYFFSFVSCLFYGLILDFWRAVIPALNPEVCEPGSFSLPVRILLLFTGMTVTSFSVALFFRVYPCPQVYDFFVKAVSARFGKPLPIFKTCYDIVSLLIALVMTLLFFGGIRGIGIGTALMTFLNGPLIGFFGKVLDRYFEFRPLSTKIAERFRT